MLKVLLLSLSRQYTVDGQYIPSLFIEPEVRHDKTSYEEARYILLNKLREQLGIQDPSVYTLLGYEGHVELPNWRDLICEEIGQYIERTEIQRNTGPETCISTVFSPINFILELFLIYVSVNWREITREENTKELKFTFGGDYQSAKFSL